MDDYFCAFQLDAFVDYQENRRKKTGRRKKSQCRSNDQKSSRSSDKATTTREQRPKLKTPKNQDTVDAIFKKYRSNEKDNKSEKEDCIDDICRKYRNSRGRYTDKLREAKIKASQDGGREASGLSAHMERKSREIKVVGDTKERNRRSKSEDTSERLRRKYSILNSTNEILKSLCGHSSPGSSPRHVFTSTFHYTPFRNNANKTDSEVNGGVLNYETKENDRNADTAMKAVACTSDAESNLTYRSCLSVGKIGGNQIHENITKSHEGLIGTELKMRKENDSTCSCDDAMRRQQLQKRLLENGRRFRDRNEKRSCSNAVSKDESKSDVIISYSIKSRDNTHSSDAEITHDSTMPNLNLQTEQEVNVSKESVDDSVKIKRSVSFWGDDDLSSAIQEDLEKWRGRRRERMNSRPVYHRSRSEGANKNDHVIEDKCADRGIRIVEKPYQNEAEIEEDMRHLQEKVSVKYCRKRFILFADL